MSSNSLLPALICIAIAYATSFCISVFYPVSINQNKYPTLDGLRGYLAFFVFIHHAMIWSGYVHTGIWMPPSSLVYGHFGITSVALFFMITGFLFWTKLISGKSIQWGNLFLSRILRLAPLYLFMVMLVLLIVAFATGFTLVETPLQVFKELLMWCSLSILGAPPINAFKDSPLIISNVIWSLPYEWMFYFSLPICAVFITKNRNAFYTITGIIAVGTILYLVNLHLLQVLYFGGGIAAAYLVHSKVLKGLAGTWVGSILCLSAIIAGVAVYPYSKIAYLLLISAGFILITCGNTLFGMLTTKASHVLGQMGYSIYLLHAISLYVSFKMIFTSQMTNATFWLIVFCLVPLVIVTCHFTYVFIEKQFMDLYNVMSGKQALKNIARPKDLKITAESI